jgi:site-specific DNA-cytosine methylase
MKVLIACESSGIVRDQFRLLGADAYSCDLLPADTESEYHIICDVFNILFDNWDLVIAHPPCTYLSVSGQHWNYRRPERKILTAEAVNFFLKFTELNCAWAIENPVGIMSTNYRKPDQIIQPYQFGDDASKRTCLWLKDLPPP